MARSVAEGNETTKSPTRRGAPIKNTRFFFAVFNNFTVFTVNDEGYFYFVDIMTMDTACLYINDDFHVNKETNTLTFSVTTLTACSDPSVNYYDSGEDSVNDFIKELKDIIQIENIEYVEDWDFDDYGSVTQSGNIVIKLGRK